jgi:hypothetical protein
LAEQLASVVSVTITNQNLDLYRGDSETVFIGLTDEAGAPYDPTSALGIRYRVAKSAHAVEDEYLISKSMGAGITAAEGGIDIALDASDTDWPAATYYHELKIYGANGSVSTAMTGSVTIRRSLKMTMVAAQMRLVGNAAMKVVPT